MRCRRPCARSAHPSASPLEPRNPAARSGAAHVRLRRLRGGVELLGDGRHRSFTLALTTPSSRTARPSTPSAARTRGRPVLAVERFDGEQWREETTLRATVSTHRRPRCSTDGRAPATLGGAAPPWSGSRPSRSLRLHSAARRGAGAVERGGLENRWACKRLLGSNPSPAVIFRMNKPLRRLLRQPAFSAHVRSRPLVCGAHWRANGAHSKSADPQLVK